MQHDERRVQSSPTTRGTSFAARRAACELGAGERARVHLCHAVPRVTGSCGPLYLLMKMMQTTLSYSLLTPRYTIRVAIQKRTTLQKRRRRGGLRRRRRRCRCCRCCCRCRSRPCCVRLASRGSCSGCVLEHTPGARTYQAKSKRERGKEAKRQSDKEAKRQRGKDQRGKEAKRQSDKEARSQRLKR